MENVVAKVHTGSHNKTKQESEDAEELHDNPESLREHAEEMEKGDDEEGKHAEEKNNGLLVKDDHYKLCDEECINEGVCELCARKDKLLLKDLSPKIYKSKQRK